MSRYRAQAVVALPDPEAVLAPLCEHLTEHGAALSREGSARIIRFEKGEARFQRQGRAASINLEAGDVEALYFLRLNVSAHLVEYAPEAASLIEWRGDGNDFKRPLNFHILEVVRTAEIAPHMRRITFAGGNLVRFAPMTALHLNLLVQRPECKEPQWPTVGQNGLMQWAKPELRPWFRKYTVRALDLEAGTMDIDFVIHEDAGPGSDFALKAKPGDPVGVAGPGGGGLREAQWYLFAGDETALPAISRMLEHLPASARGRALIEVQDEREIQSLRTGSAVEVEWLLRGDAEAGTTTLLADAVRAVDFPTDGTSVFAWAGCEFDAFRAIRMHLREDRGLGKQDHLVVAYWRRGQSEDEVRRT
ncbi:Siderophore-interacting protein [Nitratireductor indicus C115]|uniref:Siderophore-interacting protein n=1 Tax=Nitratireductor indicus C115 TaxID=1231190 RepID=K2NL27_9HYPH|nr:siderophore-interacting protein [Nitratireductor indicus]EKF40105.1 Siderophore-interacting protein [Nitratireductor indicus C115]SFQ79742.1 NADPH-dependent ferric siderophore reductase, contains FAD-binding and SIP domains [Nitratireductor indicus]